MKKLAIAAAVMAYALIAARVVCLAQENVTQVSVEPSAGTAPAETEKKEPRYIVLAWNDLGMHCYSSDFSDMAILPPYNTLWAQVIKAGEPAQIVTSGIIVEYSFKDNSYSAGRANMPDKTNFWKNVKKLFGVDLAADAGLAGKGLTGRMDPVGDHFEAAGIPLTEYRDQDVTDKDRSAWNRFPYQLAIIIVKDAATGKELCWTTVVAPVSSELNCARCHADEGIATARNNIVPTGKASTNILALHDKLNRKKYKPALMDQRPVLCARCHSSNALGTKGKRGLPNLSHAIHEAHSDVKEITPDTAGCYNCHPGSKAQCLRDTMSANYILNCTTCHGTMEKVAENKNPWKNEPRCDNRDCHGAGYRQDKPLYNKSRTDFGVYCAGCHDSPHAIAPSREENDRIKFNSLQGNPGTLRQCSVCHVRTPEKPFKHK